MHTRKKARYGGRADSGRKLTLPIKWHVALWLGVIALAVWLVVLTPPIRDNADRPAPSGLTHNTRLDTNGDVAAWHTPPAPQTVPAAQTRAGLDATPAPLTARSPGDTAH